MIAPMKTSRLAFGALVAALALSACECTRVTNERPHRIESFGVKVNSIQVFGVSGSDTFDAWSAESPMPMPRVGAVLAVEVWAKDENGDFLGEYQNPVSFRVTPGNVVAVSEAVEPLTEALAGGTVDSLRSTNSRMLPTRDGVARGFVLVEKVFGEAQLWAQDSPPPPIFALPATSDDELPLDAGTGPDTGLPGLDAGPDTGWDEVDGGRTFIAGISDALWFAAPTIADTQLLPGKTVGFSSPWCPPSKPAWNNRVSPFIGNFLTIDAPPPKGDMIVTAVTAEGFYAADLLAPPITSKYFTDDPTENRTLPGTYGYMYIYNYNYPDGLFTGDRVLSLTGTVQEFSGDTQMVFPSWIRKEGYARPQDRAAPILLDFSDAQIDATGAPVDGCVAAQPGTHCDNGKAPTFYSLRCVQECGQGNCAAGTVCIDDQACGCKLTPVDTCAAAIPGSHCETEGGQCAGTCPGTPCPDDQWCVQHHCVKRDAPCENTTCPAGERCNPTTGACECGPSLGYRISKTAAYKGTPAFQKVTEWMDVLFAYSNNNQEIESLESAIVKLSNAAPANTFVNCDSNGNSNIPPFRWNSQTDVHGCFVSGGTSAWFCDQAGDDTVDCECNRDCITGLRAYDGKVCAELNTFRTYGQWLVQVEDKWKTRINVSTRDALPDFDPRVFAKEEYAGCRVDLTGVLRQVQAARPRWLILARDENDFCCRATAGARCPTPDDVDADGVAHPGMCPKCPSADQ